LQNWGRKIEKEMSPVFQAKLDQKITETLSALSVHKAMTSPPRLNWKEVLNNYLRSFNENFMSKKLIIGLTIGTALIVIVLLRQIKPIKQPAVVSDIDSLAANLEQTASELENAVKSLDDIDSTEDDEAVIASLINSLSQETGDDNDQQTNTPPSETIIDTSDLDALLNSSDTAANSADSAINDFNSIDESEDNVSI